MKNTFNFCVNIEERKNQYTSFMKEHEALLKLHNILKNNMKSLGDMRNLNICEKNLYELRYKYISAFVHCPKKLTIEDINCFTNSLTNNLSLYENKDLSILLKLREQIVKTNSDYLKVWCPKYEKLKSDNLYISENYKSHMDNYQIILSFFDNKTIVSNNKNFNITPFDQIVIGKLLSKQRIINSLKNLNYLIYLTGTDEQYSLIKDIMDSIKADINANQLVFKDCLTYIYSVCEQLTDKNIKLNYFKSPLYTPSNLNEKKDSILKLLNNKLPNGLNLSENGMIYIEPKQFDMNDVETFYKFIKDKTVLSEMKLNDKPVEIE